MRTRVGILIGSLLAALAYPNAPAYACTCGYGSVDSDPANSASGFPRNRAITLKGPIDPDSLVLENVDGATHAFELIAYRDIGPCGGVWWIEMIPTPALAPNAHYEIRGTKVPHERMAVWPRETFATRFSTSSELLPDPELEPPDGVAVVLENPPNMTTSCGRFDATGCFRVDDPTDIEVVMRDGDEILEKVTLRERDTRYMVWRMPTCIDLVRRAPTGRRSAPLSFCGDDLRKLSGGGLRQCDDDVFGGTLEPDDSEPEEAPRPGREGASGGPATSPPREDERSRPMAAGDADHREYGCAAVPGRNGPRSLGAVGLIALLSLAILRRRAG